MQHVLIASALAVAGLMLLMWLLSLARRDVSIVDAAWGLGFVMIVWVTVSLSSSTGPARWLLAGLTTVWGVRLSGYLAWRNHGQPEDKRYARMRSRWGEAFPLVSLFSVFVLQGVVMWVVSLPLQSGVTQSRGVWSVGHVAGCALWGIGFVFEAVGDWQLSRFKSQPAAAGRILDRGLWRYTRHPNYFGDFCVWWGLFVIAQAGGAAAWTIIGPLTMSLLLMFVSGVTLLERDLTDRKADYADYVRRTNAFFPGPPRDVSTRSIE